MRPKITMASITVIVAMGFLMAWSEMNTAARLSYSGRPAAGRSPPSRAT